MRVCAFLLLIFVLLSGCAPAPAEEPPAPVSPAVGDEAAPVSMPAPIIDVPDGVYEQAVEALSQEYDVLAITRLEEMGLYPCFEGAIVPFLVEWDGEKDEWLEKYMEQGYYLFFRVNPGNEYHFIQGRLLFDRTLEQLALSIGYDVNDIECTVQKDGDVYRTYVGPGSRGLGFAAPEGEPVVERQDSRPVYSEGDYWFTTTWPEVACTYYYSKDIDMDCLYEMTITDTAYATYRGVRVGMTLDEVIVLYPEFVDEPWRNDGDYFWFGGFRGNRYWGTVMTIQLEGDVVSSIGLDHYRD